MVGCSAPNCQNRSEKGLRLFPFPRDEERRRKWLVNCRRDKWSPTSTSRLCEKHFESSQYEANRADGWRKLKPNAIPTLFCVPNPPRLLECNRRLLKRRVIDTSESKASYINDEHSYAKRATANDSTDSISSENTSSSNKETEVILNNTVSTEATLVEPVTVTESCTFTDFGVALNVATVTAQPSPREHQLLKEQVQLLTKKTQDQSKNIRVLKRKLKASSKANHAMTMKIKKLFHSDQLRILQSTNSSNRGRKWSSQTVQKGLQLLFACGETGYKVLREQQYPLPAARTLRKSLEGLHFCHRKSTNVDVIRV